MQRIALFVMSMVMGAVSGLALAEQKSGQQMQEDSKATTSTPKLQLKSLGGVSVSKEGDKLFVNYKEPVPVKDLIKTMARASGKNVILDRQVGDAKVAVSFAEPLPNSEAFDAIVAALEKEGLQVNDDGAVVHVTR